MIKAVFKDGTIKPVDPIPEVWVDGQELLIEDVDADRAPTEQELRDWYEQLETHARQIPPEDDEAVMKAVDDHRRDAKAYMRKEWGLD